MSQACFNRWVALLLLCNLFVNQRAATTNFPLICNAQRQPGSASFPGSKAGGERTVSGVKLCWHPPGRFPHGQPARRTWAFGV